jgi:hypothetical protein
MGWSCLSRPTQIETICLSLWATGGSAILRLSMSLQRATASVLMVCVLATSLSGCTSMRPVRPVTDPSVPTWGPLKAGDTVIVQTPNGDRRRFVVQQMDGDTVIAPGGQRYPQSEIFRLQRKSFSTAKTVGLVAGIAGGIFVLVGIAMVSALTSWE